MDPTHPMGAVLQRHALVASFVALKSDVGYTKTPQAIPNLVPGVGGWKSKKKWRMRDIVERKQACVSEEVHFGLSLLIPLEFDVPVIALVKRNDSPQPRPI